ncbi:hypothetical protein F5X98DRAFT_387144 [Xylaria grammica]|nr:hypothetical protein F5X98DRAFT_387144 [Xylaria grammica]
MTDTANIAQEINQSRLLPPPPLPLPNLITRPPIPTGPRTSSATSTPAKKRAKMAAQYGLADSPREPHPLLFTSATFKPCHMFFYGTLMDPYVLQHVTRYPTKPVMRPGWITGFKLKIGALISVLATGEAKLGQGGEFSSQGDAQTRASESSIKIHGIFWKVEDYQYFWALQQYETSAYRGYWCRIHVEGNSQILRE